MNTALPPIQKVPNLPEAKGASSREVPARSKLVELAPVSDPMPARHQSVTHKKIKVPKRWGTATSFILCVLLPVIAAGWYLSERAQNQFTSSTAFAIRSEEPASGLDLFSGFAAMASSSSSDVDILSLFLTSQDLVSKVQSKLDIQGIWSAKYDLDPVFALAPDGTIEDLTQYWERMVHVNFDANSGLIELLVKAFNPDDARAITQTILDESTHLMNHLSDDAQTEMIKSAAQEHELAKSRLTEARMAVLSLRAKTGMVDPEVGLSGDSGVLKRLQENLADELVKLDLLRSNQGGAASSTGSSADVRISQNEIKIEVLESRIAQERKKFGANNGEGFSEIIAQFEDLLVEQRFAEEAYIASTAALDVARADARRSSRYLAVFVQPTLAERALYPQRFIIGLLIAVFALLLWSLFVLVAYSIRDRRPV